MREETDLYNRQEDLDVRDGENMSVAVVGCGGVGAWVGLLIALAGANHMELFDGDTLEISNLNRMPYPPSFVGKMKSEALGEFIHNLRPEAELTARPHFNEALHRDLLLGMSHVVVSTDNIKTRQEIAKITKGKDVRYVECGAEALQASASSSPPEWSTDKEEQAGYERVPSFVGPCVVAAALAATQIFCESWGRTGRPDFTYQAAWSPDKQIVRLLARKEHSDE